VACPDSYSMGKGKGKGKVHPRTGHEDPEGEYRYTSTLSLTSALDGVGGQRHAPAVLPPGKRPGTSSRLGSKAFLNGCGKSRTPPRFDPRTVQPVESRFTHSMGNRGFLMRW
jgi:hypothetical protein